MAQSDKYDYDYLKSLIHMSNGKIARGRDWIAYHLFHEAEGGGLPRDPYVAWGRLRHSHGACAALGRRGVCRRRRDWARAVLSCRRRGGEGNPSGARESVLRPCLLPWDPCSEWERTGPPQRLWMRVGEVGPWEVGYWADSLIGSKKKSYAIALLRFWGQSWTVSHSIADMRFKKELLWNTVFFLFFW